MVIIQPGSHMVRQTGESPGQPSFLRVPLLDLQAQYRSIGQEVLALVDEIMQQAAFVGGPQVQAFEEEFAAFCGSTYCLGVSSGTDALRFALLAAGVGPGDEVVTVPNTFIATTEAISQCGARPVFVDIDPNTCTLNPACLAEVLSPRTKAIVPVHLYGHPADMGPILDLADRHGLAVIEDACQAHGARYNGAAVGSLGTAGCFSFYPGKNLGACGEAGAVVTQDRQLADRIRRLRDHGQSRKYYHDEEGFNGRLDAIQAGILRIKLKHLPGWNGARRAKAEHYGRLLAATPGIECPRQAAYATTVYHLYVIHCDERDWLHNSLRQRGITTGFHYPLPLHLQKAYAHLGYAAGDFPVAERSARRLLSLPMYPELHETQVEYVAACIREFQNQTTITSRQRTN